MASRKLTFTLPQDLAAEFLRRVPASSRSDYVAKAIADKMGLSIHTVRGYMRRIYEKLQVHTRTEAVAKYLERS